MPSWYTSQIGVYYLMEEYIPVRINTSQLDIAFTICIQLILELSLYMGLLFHFVCIYAGINLNLNFMK